MKKWFMLWALLISFTVQGQNYFSLVAAQTNLTYTGTQSQLAFTFKLANSSAQVKPFKWTRTDVCPLPQGWSAIVCDCINCYDAQLYQKADSAFFLDTCHSSLTYFFSIGAAMGSHTTKMNFTDPLNAAATADIYLTVNGGCPTGTKDLTSVYSLSVFPNPVTDQVRVGVSAAGVIRTLRVLDVSGRSLLEQPFPASATEFTLHFPFLSPGTYLLQAIDWDGRPMGQYRVQKF